MSETHLSRTEIAMRVRGIIADAIGRAPVDCHEENTVIGLGLDEMDAGAIVARVEISFGIILESDAEETFMQGTIGQFIDLVEGQVRAGAIA